jgi:PadR family transcriptional regulator PadR
MAKDRRSGVEFPGEFEQMVLLAILQARDEASVMAILGELDRRAGRRTDRGALYKTLDRLETKGLVDWSVEAGTPERGGHRRRRFRVRPEGLEVLRVSRRALVSLWEGLDPVLVDPTG